MGESGRDTRARLGPAGEAYQRQGMTRPELVATNEPFRPGEGCPRLLSLCQQTQRNIFREQLELGCWPRYARNRLFTPELLRGFLLGMHPHLHRKMHVCSEQDTQSGCADRGRFSGVGFHARKLATTLSGKPDLSITR